MSSEINSENAAETVAVSAAENVAENAAENVAENAAENIAENTAENTAAREYKPTFVDRFFAMHARACERHKDKGGVYNLVRWLVNHEEIVVYLVVGVLTTIVAWGTKFLVYWLAYGGVDKTDDFEHTVQNAILSLVNWTAGVIFAYFTNRAYVFKSHGPMLPEAGKFAMSRLATYFMDLLIMFLLNQKLGLSQVLSTVISAVFVTVTNYVLSKLMVFRKKNKNDNKIDK